MRTRRLQASLAYLMRKHCDDNNAQFDASAAATNTATTTMHSPAAFRRDVRYARTTINTYHVS